MAQEIRVRMAPAPTGRFHIGSARMTLHNWLFARHHGGKFILRIEDTDQTRSSRENVEDILDAIRWLGLDWDEGPEVAGDYGPYLQSQRLDRYREAAQRLVEEGKAYPCFCTPEELEARRKEMQRQGQPPRYDRRCRSLSPEERAKLEAAGRPKAIRFALPDEGVVAWDDLVRGHIAFENAALDDFVLVKSDGYPSYLLACAVDDAAMQISHVLRGEDLISGTPRQIHVYQALGLPLPKFAHLPLLLGPDRAKLSKRHGATALADYREQGYLPEAVVNFIALLGWSPGDDREVLSREELIAAFSIDGIGKSGAVFDVEKLEWMNGVYLREMPPEKYVAAARPFLERAGLLTGADRVLLPRAGELRGKGREEVVPAGGGGGAARRGEVRPGGAGDVRRGPGRGRHQGGGGRPGREGGAGDSHHEAGGHRPHCRAGAVRAALGAGESARAGAAGAGAGARSVAVIRV